MGKKTLVFGIGINDADYVVKPSVNGRRIICQFYGVWHDMISRCHSEKFKKLHPTYIGCTVAPIWHSFMAFRSWMMNQDWAGKHLDNDILQPGSRVYGPETCTFVSPEINLLFGSHASGRGDYPIGVCRHTSGSFSAQCSVFNSKRYRALFSTAESAHAAWQLNKAKSIRSAALLQDGLLQESLIKIADRIDFDRSHGVETTEFSWLAE